MVETTATPSTPGTGSIDPDLTPGEVVGEYRVESKLGQGGFGAVFKAVHPLIGKQVAVKVLSHRFSVDPAMLSRFVAEARAVNQIRHRNIIDIFSFGSLADGRHYYVMEYLDGEPLDRRIHRQGRLLLEEAIPILRGIARALDAAHAKGIAHRDLKAENVFLGREPDGGVFPKLLDFGIAKLMAPEDALVHKTRTGAPMGTPHYMSPEQCHGRDVDHRTDFYAFGVLMYVMLTGAYPIDGDDYMTILMRQVNDEPAPPSSHVPELPPVVDATISWLMRKDPAARPQTLVAAMRRLDPTLAAEAPAGQGAADGPTLPPGIGVSNPTPGGAVAAALQRSRASEALAATSVSGIQTAADSPAALATRRRRLTLLVAGGALLAAAVVIAVVALRGGERAPAAPPLPPGDPAAGRSPAAVTPDAPAAPVAPATPDAAAPARPAYVFVTIEGAPVGTEVRRAGELVGTAPGRVQLPRSDAEVLLVLSAEGYAPATLVVTPTEDLTRTAKLTPRGGGARPAGPTGPTPRPRGGSGGSAGSGAGKGSGEPTDEIDQFPPPKQP